MSSTRPSSVVVRHVPGVFLGASLVALAACGGGAPPAAPTGPAKPVATAVAPPVDLSPVGEPEGLVLVGRVTKPDAVLKTASGWASLPLPGGNDLVRSLTDDAVGDSVDMSQPVDAAGVLIGGGRSAKPSIAISVAVRSFDEAKAKLSTRHKLTPSKNGAFVVEGIGRAASNERGRSPVDEDEEEGETCALAPAIGGARLVCGEREAIDLLTPYLTRGTPKLSWPSDVHMEVRFGPLREPLTQVRASLPFLARSLLGTSSPALRALVDASVNELVDFVSDATRMTIDAQLADAGATATMKLDYATSKSLLAQLATSKPERADVPPPAFFHLPADTDLAVYGKGSDPKLFDRPRELLGNAFIETGAGAGMPEEERKAVRELVVDRMLALFNGPLVYGKGFDAAALDKALAATKSVKAGDLAAQDEAERLVAEQVVGWHLLQVTEPVTKVGPILKDWANLWNRPSFAKWAKQQAGAKMLAQMRVVAGTSGVPLPNQTVHLEIVMPRADLEEAPAPPTAATRPGAKPGPAAQAGSAAKVKKIPRKPVVLHVFAVPDQGGTWIGFGLDGKLVAQRAAAALSTAPDATTLGKTPAADPLRDVRANGAWLATLKGFLVFTALDHGARSPYAALASLPNKGVTPMALTFVSQGPSPAAAAGSAVSTFKVPRGAIEDLIRVALTSH